MFLNKLADNIVFEVSTVLNIKFDKVKLNIKLKTPCINFKVIYLTIDILFLLIKEEVCAITDIPEKEAKKLITANLKCIVRLLEAIILQPLVNSILPKNVPYNTFLGMLKKLSILLKKVYIKEVFFNIDITTENATTYPHTDKVVLIAFLIPSSIASPKFILELVEVFFFEIL